MTQILTRKSQGCAHASHVHVSIKLESQTARAIATYAIITDLGIGYGNCISYGH